MVAIFIHTCLRIALMIVRDALLIQRLDLSVQRALADAQAGSQFSPTAGVVAVRLVPWLAANGLSPQPICLPGELRLKY